MIAVIQAHKEGKNIQFSTIDLKKWNDTTNVFWNFSVFEYRVKPEPKVIYVNEYHGNDMGAHLTYDLAVSKAASGVIRKAVKYVEVIE